MSTRSAVFLFMLTLLAALGFWFGHDARWQRETETPVPLDTTNDYLMNFKGILTHEDGTIHYRIQGKRLTRFYHDGSTEIVAPTLHLRQTEKEYWVLNAERGWITSDQTQIHLLGEVYAHQETEDHYHEIRITTHDVVVWPEQRFAQTDAFARIEGRHYHLEGMGMAADFATNILTLKSQTYSIYTP